jgi:hypothetical protein
VVGADKAMAVVPEAYLLAFLGVLSLAAALLLTVMLRRSYLEAWGRAASRRRGFDVVVPVSTAGSESGAGSTVGGPRSLE